VNLFPEEDLKEGRFSQVSLSKTKHKNIITKDTA